MAKRKAISNKLRFEVFKRDSFKCQYCGESAPDVILNVDHIEPVAKGGGADILNLITSCFECNSGKKHRRLSDNSVLNLQKKQLDDLNERRTQLTMMIEWKNILTDQSFEIDSIVAFFNKTVKCDISLTETGIKSLKTWIKKYSLENILDAIKGAYDKHSDLEASEIWEQIPRTLDWITASEDDKTKMKLFGGIKGRFKDDSQYTQWRIIYTNKQLRELFKIIDSKEYKLEYSDLFACLNSHHRYNHFSDEITDFYNAYCQ